MIWREGARIGPLNPKRKVRTEPGKSDNLRIMAFDMIEAAAREDASRSEWLLRGAQAAQTVLIPALIAGLAWFREEILKVGGGLFFLLLVTFMLIQIALFIISLSAKQSVQDLYFASRDLKLQLEEAITENQLYKTKTELFILTEKFASLCSHSLLDYSGQPIANSDGLV
jgi:hypothetical protein